MSIAKLYESSIKVLQLDCDAIKKALTLSGLTLFFTLKCYVMSYTNMSVNIVFKHFFFFQENLIIN